MTTSASNVKEAQCKLHHAALGWMFQNQKRFEPSSDRLLCASAVQYLMKEHDASQESAENAVVLAYGELRHESCQHYLDISLSSSVVAAIRDPVTGMVYALPVKTIVDRLIRPKQPRRIYLVDSPIH